MQEVKFCYQNISIDVQKDKAVVKNKNLFVNTDTFACVVLLEKEGKKLKEVPMEVSVEPLSEKRWSCRSRYRHFRESMR